MEDESTSEYDIQMQHSTKQYLQRGVCSPQAERRENTGTKITVYSATDLNCKSSLGMSFLPYFVLYVASALNDYCCICPQRLIYEHVVGSGVCFRTEPHENRGEGR